MLSYILFEIDNKNEYQIHNVDGQGQISEPLFVF